MTMTSLGFCVIYRWSVRPGEEERFCKGWDGVTRALMAERGALGSRVHKADDGTWVAYAQWPDRESWERSRKMGPIDQEDADMMKDAILESSGPVLLTPMIDHLKTITDLRGRSKNSG